MERAETEQRRKPGRPRAEDEARTSRTFRLTPSDWRLLDAIAEHEGHATRSDAVRDAIRFRHENLTPFPD